MHRHVQNILTTHTCTHVSHTLFMYTMPLFITHYNTKHYFSFLKCIYKNKLSSIVLTIFCINESLNSGRLVPVSISRSSMKTLKSSERSPFWTSLKFCLMITICTVSSQGWGENFILRCFSSWLSVRQWFYMSEVFLHQ